MSLIERFDHPDSQSMREARVKAYELAASCLQPGWTVLDVGCGNGEGTYMLACADKAQAIEGIDPNLRAISHAQDLFRHPALAFQHADFLTRSNRTHAYDAVVCFHALERMTEDTKWLQTIFQALKPGGALFLSGPNQDRIPCTIRQHPWNKRHYRPGNLEELLTNAKFRTLRRLTLADGDTPAWSTDKDGDYYLLVSARPGQDQKNPGIRDAESRAEKTKRNMPSVLGPAVPSPTVSVIMPTYQRPHIIGEAIQSVLVQTFPDFELIVVDDGGCGETQRCVSRFNDPRIQYLRIPHGGLSCALNAGLKAARGTYIGYLDDDDIYYPQHLALLVQALETGTHQVVYSDAMRAVQQPAHISEAQQPLYQTIHRSLSWQVDFSRELYLVTNFTPVLSVMHRKDLLDCVGGFDEQLPVLMDWDFWIRMSQHTPFRRIPEVTCEFRVRDDGTNMSAERQRDFTECRRIINERYVHLLTPLMTGIRS